MKRICIAMLCPFIALHGFAQTCASANVTCATIQGTQLKRMFEVVQGASDGRNQSFELTDVPFGNVPVRLFRNGRELRSGSDFTVQGKSITLSASLHRQAGDVLQAAFSVETGTIGSNRSDRESPTTPNDKELLSVYLHRALQREMELSKASIAAATPSAGPVQTLADVATTASTLPTTSPILSGEPPLAPSNVTAATPEFASLRMLSRALAGDESVETRSSNRSRLTRQRVRSLQGSDGLGDIPFSDPFSVLADRSDGLNTLLDGVDSQSLSQTPRRVMSRETKQSSRGPRALHMLQRTIESTQ